MRHLNPTVAGFVALAAVACSCPCARASGRHVVPLPFRAPNAGPTVVGAQVLFAGPAPSAEHVYALADSKHRDYGPVAQRARSASAGSRTVAGSSHGFVLDYVLGGPDARVGLQDFGRLGGPAMALSQCNEVAGSEAARVDADGNAFVYEGPNCALQLSSFSDPATAVALPAPKGVRPQVALPYVAWLALVGPETAAPSVRADIVVYDTRTNTVAYRIPASRIPGGGVEDFDIDARGEAVVSADVTPSRAHTRRCHLYRFKHAGLNRTRLSAASAPNIFVQMGADGSVAFMRKHVSDLKWDVGQTTTTGHTTIFTRSAYNGNNARNFGYDGSTIAWLEGSARASRLVSVTL